MFGRRSMISVKLLGVLACLAPCPGFAQISAPGPGAKAPVSAPPPPAPVYTAPVARPVPVAPAVSTTAPNERNPQVQQLDRSLPLDPATKALQNQLPPNPDATERRLGLDPPRGTRTDLRGRTPSTREIVNALAPPR